jgi:hypothetical protein
MTVRSLVSAWDALPSYQRRSLIRSLAVLCVDVPIIVYEVRRIGVKEAMTPRFIWNMTKDRQRLHYLRYMIHAASAVVQNHLNERDLAKSANAAAA